jgi:signal transduction histidine kinase
MATYSARLPRARLSSWRRRWPPIHSFLAHSLESVRTRVYLTLISVILITLLIAGVVFFFLLGGYQDRLAESTLREISAPVYAQYVESASGLEAASVSRSLVSDAPGTDIPALFVDADGKVIRQAGGTGSFVDQQLDIDLFAVGIGFQNRIEGTLESDGSALNYIAARLDDETAAEFSAEFLVFLLPEDERQSVLGDLTPSLLLAAGLAVIVAGIVGLLFSRSIYRPLLATAAAARSVARGRFDHKVSVEGTREARELAESFNHMTDEVNRQHRALREFLANVSHDLQTPLTSINGFSQALLDGTIDNAESRQNASRIIEEESRRLLRLVEGLLDLSRMEAGQLEIVLTHVEVDELLRHLHDLFSLRAEELDVRLEVVSSNVPEVSGDIDRLEQVLANLVDNALRHTPPGGNVVLSARQESPATVSIAVADTGLGIPEDAIPHLFDRFYRSDRPGAEGGTGLGLAIARELTRAQGGEVQVESAEDVGTTFRVLLRIHESTSTSRRPRSFE